MMKKKILIFLFCFVFIFNSLSVFAVPSVTSVGIGVFMDFLVTLGASYGIHDSTMDIIRNKSLVDITQSDFDDYANKVKLSFGERVKLKDFYDEYVRCWQLGSDSITMSLDQFLDMGLDKVLNDVYSSATVVDGDLTLDFITGVPTSYPFTMADTPYYFVAYNPAMKWRYATFFNGTVDSQNYKTTINMITTVGDTSTTWHSYEYKATGELYQWDSSSRQILASNHPLIQSLKGVGTWDFPTGTDIDIEKDVPVPYAFPTTMINTGAFADYVGVGDVSGEDVEEKYPVLNHVKDWRDSLVNDGLISGETGGEVVPPVDDVLGGIGVLGGLLSGIKSLVSSIVDFLSSFWDMLVEFFKMLCVPTEGFFNNHFNNLEESFSLKMGFSDYDELFKYLQDINGRKPNFGGFINIDIWNKYVPKIQDYMRGFMYVMMFLFNLNMLIWLVRGSSPVKDANSGDVGFSSDIRGRLR